MLWGAHKAARVATFRVTGVSPTGTVFSAGLCAAGVGSGFLAYARGEPGSIGTVPSAPNLGVAVNGLGQGVGFAGKEYR